MATLDVKFKLGPGATDGFVKIDRRFVRIVGGRGQIDVEDVAEHRVSMVFSGPYGATLEYEIKEGMHVLVKGKLTISYGQPEALVSGKFKLSSVQ